MAESQSTKESKKTYVKVCRSINKGDLMGDGTTQAVFLNLLVEARRFPGRYAGRDMVAGEVPLGIDALKIYTGFSKKVIWRAINKLQKRNIIDTKRGRFGTHITICNYLKYQEFENHDGNEEGTKWEQNGNEEGVHYNKEIRKERKKEKIKQSKENNNSTVKKDFFASLTADEQRVCDGWLSFFISHSKTNTFPDRQKYAEAIGQIVRLGIGVDKIEAALKFAKTDDFWRPNALSLPGLLKKSTQNGLRKIENLLASMEKAQHRTSLDKTHQNQNMKASEAKEMDIGDRIRLERFSNTLLAA